MMLEIHTHIGTFSLSTSHMSLPGCHQIRLELVGVWGGTFTITSLQSLQNEDWVGMPWLPGFWTLCQLSRRLEA